MVAFGTAPDTGEGGHWTTVSMQHVVEFVRSYLREHWEVLRHAQIKDSALCVLALLEKWGTGAQRTLDKKPQEGATVERQRR